MIRYISSIRILVGFVSPLLFCLKCNHSELESIQSTKRDNCSPSESSRASEILQDQNLENNIKEVEKKILAWDSILENISATNKELEESNGLMQKQDSNARVEVIPEHIYIKRPSIKTPMFRLFYACNILNTAGVPNNTDTPSAAATSFEDFSNDDDSLLSVPRNGEGSINDSLESSKHTSDAEQHQKNSWWKMSWLYSSR